MCRNKRSVVRGQRSGNVASPCVRLFISPWPQASGLWPLIAILLLPACIAQSKIQTSYIRQQDTCRDQAQRQVVQQIAGPTDPNATTRPDPANSLAVHFSECMNKAGWHVAVPKTGNTPPATQVAGDATPKPGDLNPSFPPAISAASAAPQPEATPAASSVKPSARPFVGPGGSSPNPPPATTSAEVPATYQPARPLEVPRPNYGSGAGRQF